MQIVRRRVHQTLSNCEPQMSLWLFRAFVSFSVLESELPTEKVGFGELKNFSSV